MFKRFTDASHPNSNKPIFPTQREFLCFLAVLGFHVGERVPLSGKAIELDSRVFDTHEQSRDVVYLLALADTRDANILQPEREDEVVTIFEEYVSGGFRELERWLRECPDDHLGDQAILSAIRREGFFGGEPASIEDVLDKVEF